MTRTIREIIGRLHIEQDAALVCVTNATVIYDAQRAYPYDLDGDVVGFPIELDEQGFTLAPFSGSFHTRVLWEDALGAWRRSEAPDPCPSCGATDE